MPPPTPKDRGLRAREVHAGYEDRPVLHGVDLALAPGERLALLGPNGAGKSTLVRVLLGFIPASSGEVTLDGRPLVSLGRTETARLVACVPQNAGMPFPFAVREVVAMGRYPHRGRFEPEGNADRLAVGRALEKTGLAPLADRPVTELSGGERQLVAIARALAQEPRYLVLDEPTANLDIAHALQVLGILESLSKEGLGVLGVVHDLALAARHFENAALLHQGKIRAQGPAREVLNPAIIQEVFGVKARVTDLDGAPAFSFRKGN